MVRSQGVDAGLTGKWEPIGLQSVILGDGSMPLVKRKPLDLLTHFRNERTLNEVQDALTRAARGGIPVAKIHNTVDKGSASYLRGVALFVCAIRWSISMAAVAFVVLAFQKYAPSSFNALLWSIIPR